jgi:hypothetical protein
MKTPKYRNLAISSFSFLTSGDANTSKLLHFGNIYFLIRFFGEILPGKKKKLNAVVKVR